MCRRFNPGPGHFRLSDESLACGTLPAKQCTRPAPMRLLITMGAGLFLFPGMHGQACSVARCDAIGVLKHDISRSAMLIVDICGKELSATLAAFASDTNGHGLQLLRELQFANAK